MHCNLQLYLRQRKPLQEDRRKCLTSHWRIKNPILSIRFYHFESKHFPPWYPGKNYGNLRCFWTQHKQLYLVCTSFRSDFTESFIYFRFFWFPLFRLFIPTRWGRWVEIQRAANTGVKVSNFLSCVLSCLRFPRLLSSGRNKNVLSSLFLGASRSSWWWTKNNVNLVERWHVQSRSVPHLSQHFLRQTESFFDRVNGKDRFIGPLPRKSLSLFENPDTLWL